MNEYKCSKGCCSIFTEFYQQRRNIRPKHRSYKKAGIFIFDPTSNKVLLVQSRGQLWGPPKGTLECNENFIDCAIREVKEETGLIIQKQDLLRATLIKNKATYFYIEKKEQPVNIQNDIEDNDANGITWIKLDCLKQCVENGHIVLNHHCKIIFKRFINFTFPKSNFITVSKRRKHRRKKYIKSIKIEK